jgi:hypothetical protein
MIYNVCFWVARIALYIRRPYVPGWCWRPMYRVRNYLFNVLPLDLQIARESARWVVLKFARLTLGLT